MPAYSVTVFEHATVYFASSELEAYEQWKSEECNCGECKKGECFNYDAEVNREPALDEYEGKPEIPIEAYYKAGWGWRCHHCDDDHVSMPGDWRPVNGVGLCWECADREESLCPPV